MAQRKSFLLRLPDDLMEELNRWARDELRSVNAQIEYVLRESVRQRRKKSLDAESPPDPGPATLPPPPADASSS